MEDKAFLQKISEIRESEKSKERIIANARAKAERIIADASESAKEIVSKAADESKKAEDSMIAQASKDIDSEEKKILERAQKDAERIKNLSLSPALEKRVVKLIIENE